jgi:hypothetical protein
MVIINSLKKFSRVFKRKSSELEAGISGGFEALELTSSAS